MSCSRSDLRLRLRFPLGPTINPSSFSMKRGLFPFVKCEISFYLFPHDPLDLSFHPYFTYSNRIKIFIAFLPLPNTDLRLRFSPLPYTLSHHISQSLHHMLHPLPSSDCYLRSHMGPLPFPFALFHSKGDFSSLKAYFSCIGSKGFFSA